MSDLAAKAGDFDEHYMLYLKAVDFAAQGGDLSLALQIVDRLDAELNIIAPDFKLKVFEKFAKAHPRPSKSATQLAPPNE